MGKKVNKRELAEIFGKSQEAIGKWQKEGMPVQKKAKSKGKQNTYDTANVYEWLIAKHQDENPREIDIERTRLIRAQAEAKELENQLARAELLPVPLVEMTWQAILTSARSHMLSLASKTRNQFPDLGKDVHKYLEDQLRIILEDMATDGLPADINKRLAKYLKGLDSAAGPDAQ